MKKTLHISILLLFSMILSSCVTTYKIKESEFNYIPYSGNEILIYESSELQIDTIKLKEYKKWNRTEKVPYRIFHDKYETYGFKLIHSNNDISKFPNFMVELMAFNWKGLRIDLRTESENMNYVNQTSFTVQEFDNIPNTKLIINNRTYADVKRIKGAEFDNDNLKPIDYFYWSEESGLLGWSSNGIEWKLREKYVPQQRI
ncbi:MAG: hypothetical protein WA775_07575 [Psychroserpens sp.]|uniref:hypothetical protein n=1 Tax=Psychroserpens sp. TaxID=2020870 RepID=UPI003C789C77